MATKANISHWKVRLGDTSSPPNYDAVEEVKTVSGLGQTNALVDVTSADSPELSKEYIAGLKDGQEITVSCNRIPQTSPPTVQEQLRQAVIAGEKRAFQFAWTRSSPEETFDFLGVCLSWDFKPSLTDANMIEFKIKISGDIS